jgi:hypothetical protein
VVALAGVLLAVMRVMRLAAVVFGLPRLRRGDADQQRHGRQGEDQETDRTKRAHGGA